MASGGAHGLQKDTFHRRGSIWTPITPPPRPPTWSISPPPWATTRSSLWRLLWNGLGPDLMRDFPDKIRSVVLDGVLPLQVITIIRSLEIRRPPWISCFVSAMSILNARSVTQIWKESFWRAVDRYNDEPLKLRYYDRYADDTFEEEFNGYSSSDVSFPHEKRTLDPVCPLLINEDCKRRRRCRRWMGPSGIPDEAGAYRQFCGKPCDVMLLLWTNLGPRNSCLRP